MSKKEKEETPVEATEPVEAAEPAEPVHVNFGKDQNPPMDVDEVFIGQQPAQYLKAGSHQYENTPPAAEEAEG